MKWFSGWGAVFIQGLSLATAIAGWAYWVTYSINGHTKDIFNLRGNAHVAQVTCIRVQKIAEKVVKEKSNPGECLPEEK